MKKYWLLALLAITCGSLLAADRSDSRMLVTVEIPRLRVSEYHRPYVAFWIQDQNRQVAANLAVWYQINGPEEKFGNKWLPDLRQWWRRSGRGLDMPVDGISGATRPAGRHTIAVSDPKLDELPPGKYTLMVEAAREVGGRELLSIDFTWPVTSPTTLEASGESELGDLTLTLRP